MNRLVRATNGVEVLRSELDATRSKPAGVSIALRIAHLGVFAILSFVGLFCMFAPTRTFDILDVMNLGDDLLQRRSMSVESFGVEQRATHDEEIAELTRRYSDKRRDLGAVGKLAVPPADRLKTADFNQLTVRKAARYVWEARESGPELQVMIVKGVISAPIIFWPLIWTLAAFIYRGSYSYRLVGLRLVRRDGARASRWVCAIRAALVWIPMMVLLLTANGLRTMPGSTRDLSDTLWWVALGLLAVYAYVAVVFPSRSLHDVLVGTWLVPE